MVEYILKKPEIGIWIFNGLVTLFGLVASFLFGLAIYYFKEQRAEHKENGKKLSKLRGEYFNLRQSVSGNLEKIHTSSQSLWDEINKLRRAVVSGTMVLKRRKKEVAKVVEDQQRTEDKVGKHSKIHESQIKALQRHNSRLDLMNTEILELKEDLIMIKNKGSGRRNGTNS